MGSRKADEPDLAFTTQIGELAAQERGTIVSGGARGVDEYAMLGAAKHGGYVIGVLADSLLKAATSAKWRNEIIAGNVVLISLFYPEASFSVGNAMARNKYIYCLSDSSLVIHSGKKGGTISGAEENLKNQWIPLWVKPTEDKQAANSSLVERGGAWCDKEIQQVQISHLLNTRQIAENSVEQADLFAQPKLFEQEKKQSPTLSIDFYTLFINELEK